MVDSVGPAPSTTSVCAPPADVSVTDVAGLEFVIVMSVPFALSVMPVPPTIPLVRNAGLVDAAATRVCVPIATPAFATVVVVATVI